MICSKIGEVVGYGVMFKICWICSYYKNEFCEKDNDCRKRWFGSLKLMDLVMIVIIIKILKVRDIKLE